MSSPISTGMLAYGMSGRVFHGPFVALNPGFDLKAVVERSQKKAHLDFPGILSYDSVDQLLSDATIELVVVNTPPDTHFEFVEKALLAGKHVLVEKPIVISPAEVGILYDLAREMGKHLFVYQNRRWDSDFLSLKKVIDSGRLGQLIEVQLRFDRYKAALSTKLFKETKGVPGNGLVYDLGPHLIDQAISLFGRPLSFSKTTGIYRENSEVTDYFHIHLKYPGQLNVFLTSGLLIAQPTPAFVAHGTLGSFQKNRVDVQEAQLEQSIWPNDPQYGFEPDGEEGILTTIDQDGKKLVEYIPSDRGNYMGLFNAVHHTIREHALYPITEEHIAWQMEIVAG